MADMSHATQQDWASWCETSKTLDDGIVAKLSGLTVAQKTKLSELVDKWIGNLKP